MECSEIPPFSRQPQVIWADVWNRVSRPLILPYLVSTCLNASGKKMGGGDSGAGCLHFSGVVSVPFFEAAALFFEAVSSIEDRRTPQHSPP